MDADQLRTFDRVVREGSFTKAAAALNVTQGTVSMRIAALEQRLGGPLFSRGRRIELTERGQGFLPYARRALAQMMEGIEAARVADRGERGLLCLATLRSHAETVVGQALGRFLKRFPGVEVKVREGHHHDTIEMLHDRAVDIAITGWPNLDPLLDDPAPALILREDLVVVAAPALVGERRRFTAAEIGALGEVAIVQRWWQVMPDAIDMLVPRDRPAYDLPMQLALPLVREGRAAANFPRHSIAAELEAGRLVALDVSDMPPIRRDSALVALKPETWSTPIAANFARELAAAARELGLGVKATGSVRLMEAA